MADQHSISFFGQKNAMLMNSSSMTDPSIFVRMIKVKQNGVWEKPSLNEGKVVNISLIELGSILEVLEHNETEWKTVHKRKDGVSTSISIKWAVDQKAIWINIGDYGKNFKGGELRFFTKMLEHLFEEKIEFATHGKKGGA
ncbi:hypothetical protein LCGC14_0371730 [marine sediment metagenome]|uniref:Uncharacterized protein n=1 Tax=marine sediment metagenome TaxID=412755 RepID=A0A0F9VS92_9ZZZZ